MFADAQQLAFTTRQRERTAFHLAPIQVKHGLADAPVRVPRACRTGERGEDTDATSLVPRPRDASSLPVTLLLDGERDHLLPRWNTGAFREHVVAVLLDLV